MKLSFARASLASILSPTFLRPNPGRPIVCSSISYPSPTSTKPQTPLFLRPPTYSATLSELRQWRYWAKTLISSVGSSFLDSDNGPDTDLLHRELKWLIEDAIQDPKRVLTHLGSSDNSVSSTLEDHPKQGGGVLLRLRVEMEDLYELWRERIEERRPFQYVVGCEHWRDLVLSVEEGVLIPRPETELIVDLVGDLVKGDDDDNDEGFREGLWADLGTGSGAIAIGIGKNLGDSGRVIATDLSPVAVSVASFNVQRYHLQNKVEIKQGSWFEPLKGVEGEVVGLVSNPPYIPSKHISSLQAEVGKHEPGLALDGGTNGMDDLLHLCNGAASLLKPGGFFVFETNGEKQCKFLVDYLEKETEGSFCNVNIVADFVGIERFVTGFRVG